MAWTRREALRRTPSSARAACCGLAVLALLVAAPGAPAAPSSAPTGASGNECAGTVLEAGTRRFSPTRSLDVELRSRAASGTVLRLVRNRLEVRHARRAIMLSAPGLPPRRLATASGGGIRRISLTLDGRTRRVRLSSGGRSVTARSARLRAESTLTLPQPELVTLIRLAARPPGPPARHVAPNSPSCRTAAHDPPFAPTSFWNVRLADDAPLDPKSATYVSELRHQVEWAGPWMNTTQYSTPVYTVPGDEPRVRVQLDDVAPSAPDLVRAFADVPIPENAVPAQGTDKHLVVWQPETDSMWEFWLAARQGDGWHARWGGHMERVSQNPGYYENPRDWGATATSLPLLGGLIRLQELEAGRIDHALALGIPETRREWFSWPANRTDGHVDSPDAIPEGARFRLDHSLDLSRLRMAPIVRIIAEAAQRYGIVIRDKAGAVVFYGEDPQPTGHDPYHGPGGYFENEYISTLLREQFPWHRLQALRTEQTCCWIRR